MGARVRYPADRRAWWIYYRDGDKRWAEKIGPGEEGEREARRVAEAFNYELEQRDERKELLRCGRERPFRVVAEPSGRRGSRHG